MKILWVCPFFLHPTDRGSQIRTLGTLKELHTRHEIHFAALNDPRNTEGPARGGEFSSRQIVVSHAAPGRKSIGIVPQLLGSLLNPMPLAISRYASALLSNKIDALIATEKYDSIVCDFLAATPSISDMSRAVLFQHNVETTIFERHVEHNNFLPKKLFFQIQAAKMEAYERKACQSAKHVIAVSEIDAQRMEQRFGIQTVTSIPTGTDVEYFAPREEVSPAADIVFCGSMDWLPNVDAVVHFIEEILPQIRAKLPETTFTIAGRSPDARVLKAVEGVPGVRVTGKVDDMRPYLWGSKISIVPIRIGGGTRLKIYECMAAGIPVVSTTVGAEGLQYTNQKDIVIADGPSDFAGACIRLLSNEEARLGIAKQALELARTELSWEAVSYKFEAILERNRISSGR